MNRSSLIRLAIAVVTIPLHPGLSGMPAAPVHYSILINEFMPDPDPSAGLPASAFVELKNVSAGPVNIGGWRLGNGKTTGTIRTDLILDPDSLIILCASAAREAYETFGTTAVVTAFPSLGHLTGELILTGPDEEVIDAVVYDRESFKDPVKANGGWSLERIDGAKPCLGRSNWIASVARTGGTPGKENSVAGSSDENALNGKTTEFVRSYCPDSLHLLLILNGPVDANTVTDLSKYQIEPAAGPVSDAVLLLPFFDQILITLEEPLKRQQVYQVSIEGIRSCGTVVSRAVVRTGLAEVPDSGDLRFNEILFNPPSFGSDYIEICHAGKSIIDLRNVWLGSRDATGQIKDPRPVTDSSWLLFPGDYLVVTEDAKWLQGRYLVKNPSQLLELPRLPSMPDDRGTLLLQNGSGNRIDELSYDHSWHSPLIADESGVALEKMAIGLPSSQASGWTSAASSAGYGTPTYVNSESEAAGYDSAGPGVTAEPVVFSPDNDGYNDFCFIRVRPGIPGYTANITVYDISGRAVRTLAATATLGIEGRFRWDGLDTNGNELPSGRYVVFSEIFTLTGKVKQFRNVLVLARNR